MNLKNDHWKTYVTDFKHITGDLNWLRIESKFKPSPQDIKQVSLDKGFASKPDNVEIRFYHTRYITTWSCK
jgi:hypothetical protein